MKVSYSQITTFKQCPLKYKYDYIEKEVRKKYRREKPYYSFGSAVHRALKDFFQISTKKRSLELLHTLLRRRWIRRGFKDEEEERVWGLKALEVLENFYRTQNIYAQPIMMERYFEVDVDDFIMFGRVDRVDKIPEGFELIEYKGGKSVMTKEHMQEDLQLVFYYVGLKRGYNIEPVRFTYYFLRSNTTVSVECVPEQMQKGLVMIKEVVEKIREEKEFSPKLNDFCPSCDYNVICPLRCKIPLELGGEPPFEEEEEGWQEDAQSVEKGP